MLLNRKRRGMTNLIETICCVLLFAVILTVLITMMSFSNEWTLKAQDSMQEQLDTDYLIESLQADIKSADSVDATSTEIHIMSEDALIVYKLKGDTLYRNSEKVVSGIETVMFVPDDGDNIEVYIRFQNETLIDVNIHR